MTQQKKNESACAHELAEFKKVMPEEVAGFSDATLEKAFRTLYDAVAGHEQLIRTGEIADEIIGLQRNGNVSAIGTCRDRIVDLLEAIMRHLSEAYGYKKEGPANIIEDMRRLIWPYVAMCPDPQAGILDLTDAVLAYTDSHEEIGTLEAADFVSERCPGILDEDTLELLLHEIFDMMCEAGHFKQV